MQACRGTTRRAGREHGGGGGCSQGLPAAKEACIQASLVAAYGDEQIELLAEFYGKKGAIIDGNSRVFDGEAAIDQWRKFRTAELWNKRHMEWRPMCKELLLDEVSGRLYVSDCEL